MKLADFKIGDVVQLKSGGPKMTVDAYRTGGLTCVWHSKDDTFQHCNIRPETLVKVESPRQKEIPEDDDVFSQHPINHH